MGTPLSTCYEKRKNSEFSQYQKSSEKNNPLNLKITNQFNKGGR